MNGAGLSQEEMFLYRLMSQLYVMNAQIVFKGAMLLKVIQYTYGDTSGLEKRDT